VLRNQIYIAATNRVHWGSHSVLVVTVSHFLELDADLEVLGFGGSVGLIDDEVDAIWSRVGAATDSLTSHISSSAADNPPDGAGD
jgi:hypothetical protein